VARLNAGRWAAGPRGRGFALGKGVTNCSYSLEALDDGSNFSTHVALVEVGSAKSTAGLTRVAAPLQALLPRVDFLLAAEAELGFAAADLVLANESQVLVMSCCEAGAAHYRADTPFAFGAHAGGNAGADAAGGGARHAERAGGRGRGRAAPARVRQSPASRGGIL
jgi:hypothetical protein